MEKSQKEKDKSRTDGFCSSKKNAGRKSRESHRIYGERVDIRSGFNNMIVTLDTETSKTDRFDDKGHCYNEIVCYTLSVYSIKGEELNSFLFRYPEEIYAELCSLSKNASIVVFVHNLAYDWQFMKQELDEYGFQYISDKSLWIESHSPLFLTYRCPDNAHVIEFRDSLKMFNASLSTVCKQYSPKHGKMCGDWNYDTMRTRETKLTAEEIGYAMNDTRALAESIAIYLDTLKRSYSIFNQLNIVTLPRTSTGVPRALARHILKSDPNWIKTFKHIQPSEVELQSYIHEAFQGGYTHASCIDVNKYFTGDISCYDFSSSYPARMLMCKFPSTSMKKLDYNLRRNNYKKYSNDDMGFIGTLTIKNPHIKENAPMTYLSANPDKAIMSGYAIIDNGRIHDLDGYYTTKITNIDLDIILDTYDMDDFIITDVFYFGLDYLPQGFRNLVIDLYQKKTDLKCKDETLYNLSKAILNSLFGIMVQNMMKPNIIYEDGVFTETDYNPEEYSKWLNQASTPLPYIWGIYITAYSRYELFQLGKCGKRWIYSDTDSIYTMGVDDAMLNKYNESIRRRMKNANVPVVYASDDTEHKRPYILGIAELDKECTEYVTLGAKKYCYRTKDGSLHITVAGVPKCGVNELNDNIHNFKSGTVFRGIVTGKKMHSYIEGKVPCIDITPCDYLLDDTYLRKVTL